MKQAARTFTFFITLIVCSASVSYSQGSNEGLEAYNREAYDRGDYAESLRQWKPLAEKGDAEAQYGLGYLYYFGEGVAEDNKTAMKWFLLAAEQGNPKAQHFWEMHENGGVKRL